MFFLFKSTCPPHTVATRGCCYDFPAAAIFCLKISASGGDSVIGACTDVSGCSACDVVLFSVAVGFFFCGADFGFGGGLLGFRRSRIVSSRSLFFFLSSSRIAGRSSFGIEASATICSWFLLICPRHPRERETIRRWICTTPLVSRPPRLLYDRAANYGSIIIWKYLKLHIQFSRSARLRLPLPFGAGPLP